MWTSLREGMVITIEPGRFLVIEAVLRKLTHSGIYVPPSADFPKEFHNIGIRIEVRKLERNGVATVALTERCRTMC